MTGNFSSPNDSSEFQDSLENYEPRVYDDSLMKALAEDPVGVIQHEPFATIPADLSIQDAIEKLATMHVACLLVKHDDKLVGVFSDRDVLNQVALEFEKNRNKPVSTVMTTDPVFVYDSQTAGAALSVMAVSGYRHVPVLDSKHRIVGIISPQRVTGFLHRYL